MDLIQKATMAPLAWLVSSLDWTLFTNKVKK
jgi:hypothetical protein